MDMPPVEQIAVELKPITTQCVKAEAQRYHVPFAILAAIISAEGGQVGRYSKNKNGTIDVGPGQINSVWKKNFQQMGLHLNEKLLLNNGCYNAKASAFILRQELKKANAYRWQSTLKTKTINRKKLWTAIGNYHSKTPKHHHRYKNHVFQHLKKLTQHGQWKKVLKTANHYVPSRPASSKSRFRPTGIK